MKTSVCRHLKKEIRNYCLIILGTALMSIAYACIFDRAGLVTGGFTGIAIVIRNLSGQILKTEIPLWISNLLLNLPVFVFSYIAIGKRFVGKALAGTVMLSVWLGIIPDIDLSGNDYLLSALFGGCFVGAGVGLVLRSGASTGGTDMVATLLHRKFRNYSIAQIMQVLDGLIVLAGWYVFGLRTTLYAVVAIFTATKVSDAVLEGTRNSKSAFIITKQYEQVAQRLMHELQRGVTGLYAVGMYTKEEKCILYCVVPKKEIITVKDIVNETDPKAFIIVSDAREVLGEGFAEQTDPAESIG